MIERTEENSQAWEQAEAHLVKIIELGKSIQDGEKIILVGPNASGKSLFRRLIKRAKPPVVMHASMQLRTESRPDLGGLGCFLRDYPDDATSYSTLRNVEKTIASVRENCILHIDEPEIGFSQELQKGTGKWLRDKLDNAPDPQPLVTLITTHSTLVASAFLDWKLIDLGFQYQSVTEWINREITATDPDEIQEKNQIMFAVVQIRINERRSKKAKN